MRRWREWSARVAAALLLLSMLVPTALAGDTGLSVAVMDFEDAWSGPGSSRS
ncbi:MAG: hypothetical protein QME79_10385 [Bacillota bacterium]|nr:hypothetical protein [Bacillota bacterium]